MGWYEKQKARHEAAKGGPTFREHMAAAKADESTAYGAAVARQRAGEDARDAAKGEKATRKAERKAARKGIDHRGPGLSGARQAD